MDYETKQRQLFESPNQQQTTTAAVALPAVGTTSGGLNLNTQSHSRQTIDTAMKLKRQSSSSTHLSDSKVQ